MCCGSQIVTLVVIGGRSTNSATAISRSVGLAASLYDLVFKQARTRLLALTMVLAQTRDQINPADC